MQITKQKFIADIEFFCLVRGMTATQFSNTCMQDPSFLRRMKEKSDPRLSTVEKVYEFMFKHKQLRRGRPPHPKVGSFDAE